MRNRIAAILVLFTLVGCMGGESNPQSDEREVPEPGRILKVALSNQGETSLDGDPTSLDELRATLSGASADTAVWYYREDGQGEPPEVASSVMEAIIDARLPVSFSSEPDFSTVVMPDGTVRPR